MSICQERVIKFSLGDIDQELIKQYIELRMIHLQFQVLLAMTESFYRKQIANNIEYSFNVCKSIDVIRKMMNTCICLFYYVTHRINRFSNFDIRRLFNLYKFQFSFDDISRRVTVNEYG